MTVNEWAAFGILAALVWYILRILKYRPWRQRKARRRA